LDKGAAIMPDYGDGRTALMSAAAGGNPEMIKLLIEKGAEVNAIDSDCNTPVVIAAENGKLDAVTLLIEKGAEALDGALIAAAVGASEGHLEVVKWLVQKGANVNAKNEHGQTVLTLAEGSGRDDVVRYLKAHGAKR